MTKGTRANRGNIPAPDESPQRRRPSDLPRPARTAADNLADINEQLLTEREELRRQASEMAAFNEQLLARQEELLRRNLKLEQLRERAERAGRIARATESLARMAEDYPDPALRVAHTGQIRYMNPASYDLWRQWNPGDRQQVPPAIQELVATVYVRGEVIRREMTFGEHTYLITAVPTPPPRGLCQHFCRRYHTSQAGGGSAA